MKFKNFLIQKIPFTIAYFAGIGLVTAFFYLKFGTSSEILYPLELAFFVYAVYMIYEYCRYHRFLKDLEQMEKAGGHRRKQTAPVEKAVMDTVNILHKRYENKIMQMENEGVKEARLMSAWFHNMKTPISVNELLLQRYEADELEKDAFLKSLSEENEKLISYLDSMIDYKRMQEFEKDYRPESLDLAAEVEDIITRNKKLFIYNHVYPEFSSRQEVKVLSDKKWNRILLTQIISNAIKYSHFTENKITPKKVWFEIIKEEFRCILVIKDEGAGIPESDLGRVFDPFFTGENGREYSGASGIGLYLCTEICRMLGQKIEITSRQGEGTQVRITYLTKT